MAKRISCARLQHNLKINSVVHRLSEQVKQLTMKNEVNELMYLKVIKIFVEYLASTLKNTMT